MNTNIQAFVSRNAWTIKNWEEVTLTGKWYVRNSSELWMEVLWNEREDREYLVKVPVIEGMLWWKKIVINEIWAERVERKVVEKTQFVSEDDLKIEILSDVFDCNGD